MYMKQVLLTHPQNQQAPPITETCNYTLVPTGELTTSRWIIPFPIGPSSPFDLFREKQAGRRRALQQRSGRQFFKRSRYRYAAFGWRVVRKKGSLVAIETCCAAALLSGCRSAQPTPSENTLRGTRGSRLTQTFCCRMCFSICRLPAFVSFYRVNAASPSKCVNVTSRPVFDYLLCWRALFEYHTPRCGTMILHLPFVSSLQFFSVGRFYGDKDNRQPHQNLHRTRTILMPSRLDLTCSIKYPSVLAQIVVLWFRLIDKCRWHPDLPC